MIDFVLYYVLPILGMIALLVTVHELGHFLVARRFGVAVDTFAVGFGPRLFGWIDPRTGTDWCLRALPLGGYVKFRAEATGGRKLDGVALTGLKRWQRIAILIAGPAANLAFVPVALFLFVVSHGVLETPPTVADVVEGFPAAEAGIQAGDRLVAVNGDRVETMEPLVQAARVGLDTRIDTVWLRDGRERAVTLVPEVREVIISGRPSKVGVIGLRLPPAQRVTPPIGGAAVMALDLSVHYTENVLISIGQILTGDRGVNELMGVVGAGHVSGDVAQQQGYSALFLLLGLLSISLAVVNMAPVPVMDGGQIAILLYEGATGQAVGPRAESIMVRVGLAVVGLLFATTLWNDLVAIYTVLT